MTKENFRKVAVLVGLSVGAYAIYRMLSKKEPITKSISKAIENPVFKAAQNVLKKGSAEEKSAMSILRSKRKNKGGRKKGSKKKKRSAAVTDEKIIKKHKLKGKAAEAVRSGDPNYKADGRSKKKKIISPTSHKGHKTKRGLAQDQKRISKEVWEQRYRKHIKKIKVLAKKFKQAKKKGKKISKKQIEKIIPVESPEYSKKDLQKSRAYLKKNKYLYEGTKKYIELQAEIAKAYADGIEPDVIDFASHLSSDISLSESLENEQSYELLESRYD